MTDDQRRRYERIRRTHPFLGAGRALDWAKSPANDERAKWEEGRSYDTFTRELDNGLVATLKIDGESIFPMPNRNGETDLGQYLEEANADYDYDWEGNWPRPVGELPLGLPYTAFRYGGPGWVQGERGGYFLPDGIEEQFAEFRRNGQSKSVAWDLTRQYVEDQITAFFHAPLINAVVSITITKDGVKLGRAVMGTDYCDDEDGEGHPFEMVAEYDMLEEALQDAGETLDKLRTVEL